MSPHDAAWKEFVGGTAFDNLHPLDKTLIHAAFIGGWGAQGDLTRDFLAAGRAILAAEPAWTAALKQMLAAIAKAEGGGE